MKKFLIIIGFSFMLTESAYAISKEEVRQAIQLAKKCYRGLPPGTKDAASRTMSDAINNFNKGRDAYLGIAYDDAYRVIRAGQRSGVC